MSDDGYANDEPEFNEDFDEPIDDFDEEPTFSDNEDNGNDAGANGNVNHDFIASGDPAAAAAAAQGGSKGKLEDKKIPDDQRNTTPYMTKYERARLLGTRALQIRCVDDGGMRDKAIKG
jgi:DNA-directed RNA polymerase I, II, and III subunit RPABC2